MSTDRDPKAPSSFAPVDGAKEQLLTRLNESVRRLANGEIEDLAETGQAVVEFLELSAAWQREVQKRAQRLGLAWPEDTSRLGPWVDLEHQLEGQEERRAHERRRAVAVLDQLLSIRHEKLQTFEPLLECQAEARSLREQIIRGEPQSEPVASAKELAGGTHRFCMLLELVSAPIEISVESWNLLQEGVRQGFPARLAVAAIRGQLTLGAAPTASLAPQSAPENDRLSQPVTAAPLSAPLSAAEQGPIEEAPQPVVPTIAEPAAKPAVLPSEDAVARSRTAAAKPAEASQPVTAAPPRAPLQAAVPPALLSVAVQAPIEEAPQPVVPTLSEPAAKPAVLRSEDAVARSKTAAAKPAEAPSAGPLSPPLVLAQAEAAVDRNEVVIRPARPVSELAPLVWKFLGQGNYGLAYHVSKAIAERSTGERQDIPADWLLQGLVLAPHVQGDEGQLAPVLASTLAQHKDLAQVGSSSSLSVSLLLLAVGLRPALLAPGTYALSFLKAVQLPATLAAVSTLNERVIEHAERNPALSIELLRIMREQESWETALKSVRTKAEQWLRRAPTFTTTYAPATHVWTRWVEPGGPLCVLTSAVGQDDLSLVSRVGETIRELADDNRLRKQVNDTDRKQRTGGKDIDGTALEQLQSRTREALELGRQWLSLVQHRRNLQNGGYRLTSALRLASTLAEVADDARRELESIAVPLALRAAAACCRDAINALLHLFDPATPLPVSEPDAAMLLNGELLRLSELEINEEWALQSPADQVLAAFDKLDDRDPLDWPAAFIHRCERGDLEGSELILTYLYAQSIWQAAASEEVELELSDLRASREGHQRRVCLDVQNELDRLRRDVDTAAALALLQDRGHSSYLSDIEQIEAEIKQEFFVRFRWVRQRIKTLRCKLEQLREPVKLETERSLARLRAEHPAHNALARIEQLLARGDLLTAREYLNAAESGQTSLDVQEERDSLKEFFPERLREMYRVAPSTGIDSSYVRIMQEQRPALGLAMDHLTQEQAKRAATLIEHWTQLKQPKVTQENATKSAQQVVKELGFDVLNLQPDKRRTTGSRRLGFSVQARQLGDRGRCPVAHYGSIADGRYQLWLLWGEPTVEEWLGDIGEMSSGGAQIVFWFGALTESQRQHLADLCRQHLRTVLVIDDLLLVYLCSRPESRLRAVFDCTLPFTYLKPYVVNGEPLPPEMFYGRSRERDEVQKPTGTCFIYGGRQLGKTALLHDVRHRVHDARSGRVALYIDLRAHGIGYPHGPDRLWHKLAERLGEQKVVPGTLPSSIRGDTLLRHVEEWLSESADRRVLLLLDEADKFLEADSQDDFMRCAEIKGAMERTGRRFKVVFSGLHNVLRSTRQANHPLAHFGTPICIGPLFQEGEWREARALAERPLASLGYRFESPDLIMRMLSQVNFYPSLIQLYCDHLLMYMLDVRAANRTAEPPFTISEKHLDETYRNPRLKEKIRDRFRWTLQLDERYQVIAYAIAYLALGEDQRRVATGFSSSEIRQVALEHWSEGFTSQGGEDSFVVLLDELVGLGVLHTAGGGKYNLRSPNLMFLLGETEEDILNQLTKKREPPPVYTADTFRVSLGTDTQGQLSPFTSRQTAELQDGHGVTLIAGCRASHLEHIPDALEHALGKTCIHLEDETEFGEFARRLDTLVKQRQQDTTTLLLVDQSCAYSEQWIDEALKRVGALTSKTAFLKITFVADPQLVWSLLGDDAEGLQRLRDDGVRIVTLVPCHDAALRHWLSDAFHSGPNDQAERTLISEVTGNWPFLLGRFHKLYRDRQTSWRDAMEELKKQSLTITSEVFGLGIPGPQETLKTLMNFEVATESELCHLLRGDVDPFTVRRSLRWAEALALVRQVENSAYRLDPLVKKLLNRAPASRSGNGR